MKQIRALFLGCKPVGERCFDLLTARPEITVVAAATNVRSKTVWWNSARVADRCAQLRIPVIDNATRAEEELRAAIDASGANILLSIQHPWILPGDLLQAVGHHAFNLHNAPLPDLKGHNSANHAILDGRQEYASTVHWMFEQPDTPVIAFEERFDIAADETALSLHRKAAAAGTQAFSRLLACLISGDEVPRHERSGRGVFHERDSLDEFREIPDSRDAADVSRRARALYFPPFEPAFVTVAGLRFHVIPAWDKE